MGTANTTTHTNNGAPIQMSPQTSPASIVEPRSITERLGTEEMFLSPRVLDAGAFTRYSEMLKSIITQAGSQSRSLEDFSADAEAMIKRCDVTSEAINKRMQAGLRMIKMIDERASRTDALLEKVSAAQPDSELIATQLDKIIEQRLAKSQRRIEDIVTQAEARVQAADDRVRAADERAREAIALSDGHSMKLAELSTRVQGQLNELDARIENTRNETSKTLIEILDRTNTVTQGLNSAIDQALARAHEAGTSLAVKVDEASMLTKARIAELNNSIEPILEASQQAMRTLGIDPENPVFEDSPLARIENLVERGETQLASLDRVYRQQEDLQSQAEGVKAVFGLWLVDAANDLDVLEERKDRIVGPMNEAADKINALSPDLDANLEITSTRLTHLQIEQQALRQTIQASSAVANEVSQRMTNESGQLQALLDGSLHKLSTRVEQAGVWLGALIQRAESLGSTLPDAGQMNFGNQPVPPQAPVPVPTPAPAPAPVEIRPIVEKTMADLNPIAGHSFDLNTPAQQIEPSPEPAPEPDPLARPTSIVSPQPPRLPIDSFSFEGASIVIEHKID